MNDALRLKNLRLLLDCADCTEAVMVGEDLSAPPLSGKPLAGTPQGMGLAFKRGAGLHVTVARFTRQANATDMELCAAAVSALPFLIGLIDRAADVVRELRAGVDSSAPPLSGKPLAGTPANFAAEASIKCTEPAFKRFLMECHGLTSPATDEATAGKLRQILGITSRAELNDDALAAAWWKDLRAAFQAWRKN